MSPVLILLVDFGFARGRWGVFESGDDVSEWDSDHQLESQPQDAERAGESWEGDSVARQPLNTLMGPLGTLVAPSYTLVALEYTRVWGDARVPP